MTGVQTCALPIYLCDARLFLKLGAEIFFAGLTEGRYVAWVICAWAGIGKDGRGGSGKWGDMNYWSTVSGTGTYL